MAPGSKSRHFKNHYQQYRTYFRLYQKFYNRTPQAIAYRKRYYAKNRERLTKLAYKYWADHPELFKATQRKYYNKHRKERLAYHKWYYYNVVKPNRKKK